MWFLMRDWILLISILLRFFCFDDLESIILSFYVLFLVEGNGLSLVRFWLIDLGFGFLSFRISLRILGLGLCIVCWMIVFLKVLIFVFLDCSRRWSRDMLIGDFFKFLRSVEVIFDVLMVVLVFSRRIIILCCVLWFGIVMMFVIWVVVVCGDVFWSSIVRSWIFRLEIMVCKLVFWV